MSSDSNTATVNQDGLVTAINPGICTITAYSNDDDSLQASINIGVDLMGGTYTLVYLKDEYGTEPWQYNEFKPGTTLKIQRYRGGSDYTNVSYSVDNEHIATINNYDKYAEVTFISEGKVTVTVTDRNYTKLTDKYKYRVSNDVPIEGLKIGIVGDSSSLTEDDGTLQLLTREYPSGQLYRNVTYSVDDESIATIDAETGLLTAISNGTAVVTATSKEDASLEVYRAFRITNQK